MGFLAVAVVMSATAAEPTWDDLLWAIHQVENPRNVRTPGRAGELGPYQIKPEVWREHSGLPHRVALEPEASREVAMAHLKWIRGALTSGGAPTDCYHLALAWNAGAEAVRTGRLLRRQVAYAERVSRLIDARVQEREVVEDVVAAGPFAVPFPEDGGGEPVVVAMLTR